MYNKNNSNLQRLFYYIKTYRKFICKLYNVCLFFLEKCCNIINIGNEIKADVGVTFNSSTIVERLEVVFIC